MALYEKHVLKTDFGPREVPKLENARKWKCMFSSLGTSHCQKSVFKAFFFNKVLYNYCSKKKLERFGQYFKKSKNGFSIVFLKCYFETA